MTLSTLYCVCLLALLLALATTPVSGADVKKKRGPVPPGGACANEGDFSTGNHCVHMRGAELDRFQKKTQQDFGVHGADSAWCICLHLYKELGGAAAYPHADTSACSEDAMAATQ